MKTSEKEIRVNNAEQDLQEIKDLLQQTDDAIEEFFKSPYKNERAMNFLNEKALAYKKVLQILRNYG